MKLVPKLATTNSVASLLPSNVMRVVTSILVLVAPLLDVPSPSSELAVSIAPTPRYVLVPSSHRIAQFVTPSSALAAPSVIS